MAGSKVLEPKVFVEGLAMGESPRWHHGWLWYADWGTHEIANLDIEGQREVFGKVDSLPISFDWLPDERLVVVAGREARLKVQAIATGALQDWVDLSPISPKPWNEIVVDGRGNAYVNGIGFDFPAEPPSTGQIALVTPDGSPRLVAEGLQFPNGMAITPDNTTLIVAESYGECLTSFDILPDGTLDNRAIWAKTPGDHPDGICLDAEGAVWYGDVGTGRCVRVKQGGQRLQEIKLDRGCFACTLGGDDRNMLYMVAADYSDPRALMSGKSRTGRILAIEAPAPGAGWP